MQMVTPSERAARSISGGKGEKGTERSITALMKAISSAWSATLSTVKDFSEPSGLSRNCTAAVCTPLCRRSLLTKPALRLRRRTRPSRYKPRLNGLAGGPFGRNSSSASPAASCCASRWPASRAMARECSASVGLGLLLACSASSFRKPSISAFCATVHRGWAAGRADLLAVIRRGRGVSFAAWVLDDVRGVSTWRAAGWGRRAKRASRRGKPGEP